MQKKNLGLLLMCLTIVGFVLLATVTFWFMFFVTLLVINAIPIYGLGTCVPAVFSAFIAGLVVIFIAKESKLGRLTDTRD